MEISGGRLQQQGHSGGSFQGVVTGVQAPDLRGQKTGGRNASSRKTAGDAW